MYDDKSSQERVRAGIEEKDNRDVYISIYCIYVFCSSILASVSIDNWELSKKYK